jgi:hypothetical protein
MYPNPVQNGAIVISLPEPYDGEVLVEVISSSGELLKQVELFRDNRGKMSIDLSDFAMGVYFARAVVGGRPYQSAFTILK